MTKQIGVGTFEVTDKMRENVKRVLDTGRISYGPFSRELEDRFAKMHECWHGILSNSGTSSLQVALQAMKELHGWQDGDEVIVPALTFVATVNIVLHNRMKPVLVDVDEYYGIDTTKILEAMTLRTRAIIPVHLFGQPCAMDIIGQYADYGTAKVIEDSCETMFVSYNDIPVGSWGDIGCFSMYVAHLLTAGVGGIATTNNPDYAVKMRSLVNHGRDGIYLSIDDDDLDSTDLDEVITRRFNFEAIGHSYRITELEAAIALAQLDDWKTMLHKRRWNADELTYRLTPLEERGLLSLPRLRPSCDRHAYMMYPIVIDAPTVMSKWPLCNYLEKNGVETREMMRLTTQPVYLEMGLWNPDDYPEAQRVNERGLYVGCHQGLDLSDMGCIADLITDWFKEQGL